MIGSMQGRVCASPMVHADKERCERIFKSTFNGAQLQTAKSLTRGDVKRFEVKNFKFMKKLGVKKPAFLPDFGLEKRKALLDKFFTSFDQSSLQPILAEDVQIIGAGSNQASNKSGFISFMSDVLKPAIPNFSWSHVTSGQKDEEGYSIVKIQIAGNHSGGPYAVPNLPSVKTSNKRLSLPEQTLKVKVEDGVVRELKFLSQGADLETQIYKELGGKLPASV